MKKDIVVLVTDGIGIRNYIYSSIFKDSKRSITVLHNFKSQSIENLRSINEFNSEKLIEYKESLWEKFLRELIHLSRLHYHSRLKSNKSILANYKPNKKTIKHRFFYFLVEFCSKFFKTINYIHKLEEQYEFAIRQSYVYRFYANYFKSNSFDAIFCTHQRAVIASPIFAAAKDVGIKTLTAIYSWDNLPKARLAIRADEYIVWSPYMRNELNTYYPKIKTHQIKILGTPQFQFHYNSSYLWTRLEFAQFYNLDIYKRWLCFSGDDRTTSPFDPEYLKDIAEEISNSNLDAEWQILLRPVPVEGFERYQDVINQYPKLIAKAGGVWELSSQWSEAYPKQKDLNVLASLCKHAETVVNVGSTMALDFGMHKKPAIYINYDVKSNTDWTIKEIYKFEHFRPMKNLNPVIWLNSPTELCYILKNLNKYNEKTKTDMKTWCEIIIPEQLRKTSGLLIHQNLSS